MIAPLLTFEFYLDDGSPVPAFQPFTCSHREQIMPAARRMMETKGLRSIEVRELGAHLFTLRG